jgi:hypothetical protein
MRAPHNGSRTAALAALIVTVLFSAASGCSQSGDKAVLEGFSSVDLVGGGKSIAPDGQNDALISLRLSPGGTVTTLTVHNVDGQPAVWDTNPGNALWVLGVADKEKPKELLNKPDGSVEIKTDKLKEMLLYFADNGAVRDGKTRLSVTVAYADGTKREIAVVRK